mmetsp:Transcript_14634/g.31204  ORF Transcript_14634/g.31204 Transcript_14634/m.31204 type:complete len:678 (-) Transcript_14634:130-2163(-)
MLVARPASQRTTPAPRFPNRCTRRRRRRRRRRHSFPRSAGPISGWCAGRSCETSTARSPIGWAPQSRTARLVARRRRPPASCRRPPRCGGPPAGSESRPKSRWRRPPPPNTRAETRPGTSTGRRRPCPGSERRWRRPPGSPRCPNCRGCETRRSNRRRTPLAPGRRWRSTARRSPVRGLPWKTAGRARHRRRRRRPEQSPRHRDWYSNNGNDSGNDNSNSNSNNTSEAHRSLMKILPRFDTVFEDIYEIGEPSGTWLFLGHHGVRSVAAAAGSASASGAGSASAGSTTTAAATKKKKRKRNGTSETTATATTTTAKTTNTSTLAGRAEHVDEVTHSGTYHVQIAGTKTWKIRPHPDSVLVQELESLLLEDEDDGDGDNNSNSNNNTGNNLVLDAPSLDFSASSNSQFLRREMMANMERTVNGRNTNARGRAFGGRGNSSSSALSSSTRQNMMQQIASSGTGGTTNAVPVVVVPNQRGTSSASVGINSSNNTNNDVSSSIQQQQNNSSSNSNTSSSNYQSAGIISRGASADHLVGTSRRSIGAGAAKAQNRRFTLNRSQSAYGNTMPSTKSNRGGAGVKRDHIQRLGGSNHSNPSVGSNDLSGSLIPVKRANSGGRGGFGAKHRLGRSTGSISMSVGSTRQTQSVPYMIQRDDGSFSDAQQQHHQQKNEGGKQNDGWH